MTSRTKRRLEVLSGLLEIYGGTDNPTQNAMMGNVKEMSRRGEIERPAEAESPLRNIQDNKMKLVNKKI